MLARLKFTYSNAVKNHQDQFTFEGNEFVTSYARYLIEYLEQHLTN